jgi:hypothetical protein
MQSIATTMQTIGIGDVFLPRPPLPQIATAGSPLDSIQFSGIPGTPEKCPNAILAAGFRNITIE